MDFQDIQNKKSLKGQRLSQAAKNAKNKQWYKDQIDNLDSKAFTNSSFFNVEGVSEYKRKKVNYDLYNNIINLRDFQYVCQPYGASLDELPAKMVNRDIVSSKIKVLQGMEMEMPFSWKIVAINEEATTRREQKEFSMIREFVVNSILQPIKEEIEAKNLQETQGQDLTPEQQQQIAAKVAEELQAKTPPEVKKYMTREHQDPAEALAHQILEYIIKKENIKDKFNKGWKHALISGEEIYWVGILNGIPKLKVINPLFFYYDKSPDVDYIEDGEWAVCEYRMSPAEIMSNFGSQLTDEEIDKIYNFDESPLTGGMIDSTFTFDSTGEINPYYIRVIHAVWKSLRKIGFLDYVDINGSIQTKLVDENYKLNKEAGDISIEWFWIPEVHEGYKIGPDIYVNMGPVAGQNKDISNLWECKLPYYGAAYDNLNSVPTSPMDRMKAYQYFYNILFYRLELLLASDEGKKIVLNIKSIPRSMGIDIEKMLYFMKNSNLILVNPNEEGNRGQADVTNLVKEVDLSIAAKINEYVQLLTFIDTQCGNSVGVNKQMEGSIGPREAVTNTKQNIIQASRIVQPYFEMHNVIKGNVLQAILDTAKVAYADYGNVALPYILDDMSYNMLKIDADLLDNSVYGIFVSNASKAHEAKQLIEQLSHAALQNQRADLSDVIKIIRSESIQEAEELLMDSERRKSEEVQNLERMKGEQAKELEQMRENALAAQHEREKELITLKETLRRETEIQKQAMFSMGFDDNKDRDEDGVPDILEVAKHGVDADIKNRKLSLEENKFNHQKEIDKEKLKLEAKKINLKSPNNK